MTAAEFLAAMEALLKESDTEVAHAAADALMCAALRHLGYGAGVDAFEQLERWYA